MGAIKRLNRYPEGVVTTLYICFELTTPKKSCGDYWEHYFESGLLNNSLSQIAHEGGRAHGLLNVKPSDFFSLKVAVPGFEEQQKSHQFCPLPTPKSPHWRKTRLPERREESLDATATDWQTSC